MSLRKQLLIFGLLTLVLPWAAYRYVQEFEQVLRAGLERALLERAGTVAEALSRQALLLPETQTPVAIGLPVYAPLLAATPPTSEDSLWSLAPAGGLELPGGARLTSGVDDRFVYFSLDVPDESIVYQRRPGQAPYGDRVVVLLEPPGQPLQWLLLTTAAPGRVRAQQTAPPLFVPNSVFDNRIEATWRERAGAYSVQFRLPIGTAGTAFAIGIIDVDESSAGLEVQMHATWDANALTPGRLIRERSDAQRAVAQFQRPGDRFRVLDDEGWVIADAGALSDVARIAEPRALSLGETLIRRILRRDDPGYETLERPVGRIADPTLRRALEGHQVAAWYRGSVEREAVVAVAVPITSEGSIVGALELEQASDAILTATDQALLRLMATTFGAALLVMLGMLAFATVLSYRVGRLARAAERALGPKGEISTRLPGMRAGDEIGDLSRSFARLLERLREYTQYLRTLTSKLSHELRTPLAVVSTSLENLESEQPRSSPYLARLRQGVVRLDAILAAMSEATHIEQAIESTTVERFDLDMLVGASAAAYRDVFQDREFAHRGLGHAAMIDGSPDLVSQMLDKLVDNAVGFSALGGCVTIELSEVEDGYRLSVENAGPLLPDAMRTQIFDSLVSLRPKKGEKPHLGLGLYVAALVARFHRARIAAENLPDGSGVRLVVVFPRSPG